MPDPLDDLLGELGLEDIGGGGGNSGGAQGRKNAGHKDNNKDSKLTGAGVQKAKPVDVIYEGYVLRPITPTVGNKKTWAKVSRKAMVFPSATLYKMGTEHRQRKGVGVEQMYRDLRVNQQGVVDRVLKEKARDESQKEAMWELFDIRKVKDEVRRGVFRMEIETTSIEVIVRRVDKNKLTDVPSGSTSNANKLSQDDIIDLSIPMKEKKPAAKKQENKKQPQDVVYDVGVDDLIPAPRRDRQQHHEHEHNEHAQDFRQRHGDYVWNGFDWIYEPEQLPPAPMVPPRDHNPFQSPNHHPEIFREPEERHFGEVRESPRRMKSHSRPRTPRGYRHRGPPSLSSSEPWDEWTPPSTPDLTPARPRGSLYRDKARYTREPRDYHEEDYEIRLGRNGDFNIREYDIIGRRRRMPELHQADDYPRQRITNHAEGHEDARFRRDRRGSRGYDMLHVDPRRDRAYHAESRPRRHSYVPR